MQEKVKIGLRIRCCAWWYESRHECRGTNVWFSALLPLLFIPYQYWGSCSFFEQRSGLGIEFSIFFFHRRVSWPFLFCFPASTSILLACRRYRGWALMLCVTPATSYWNTLIIRLILPVRIKIPPLGAFQNTESNSQLLNTLLVRLKGV